MRIDLNDIFDFYELRLKCHVKSVNYFASILGYHFPEHDNDKNHEPIRTGYAYVFYKNYHKNFYLKSEHTKRLGFLVLTHRITVYKNIVSKLLFKIRTHRTMQKSAR